MRQQVGGSRRARTICAGFLLREAIIARHTPLSADNGVLNRSTVQHRSLDRNTVRVTCDLMLRHRKRSQQKTAAKFMELFEIRPTCLTYSPLELNRACRERAGVPLQPPTRLRACPIPISPDSRERGRGQDALWELNYGMARVTVEMVFFPITNSKWSVNCGAVEVAGSRYPAHDAPHTVFARAMRVSAVSRAALYDHFLPMTLA
ncbi:hypothetical protein EVAR_50180_1 [Eumeta japonica]|uniref:Uncharacterized protein n=1 Tax=Eumeta variegata TaxID=151549 RepID=A0A4C1WW65_EUMVA|nr:hypothetical protein EVAR_50180_1 [Eumeta japonica]